MQALAVSHLNTEAQVLSEKLAKYKEESEKVRCSLASDIYANKTTGSDGGCFCVAPP